MLTVLGSRSTLAAGSQPHVEDTLGTTGSGFEVAVLDLHPSGWGTTPPSSEPGSRVTLSPVVLRNVPAVFEPRTDDAHGLTHRPGQSLRRQQDTAREVGPSSDETGRGELTSVNCLTPDVRSSAEAADR